MGNLFNFLIPIAVIATALVLTLGLVNFFRGGDAIRSNKLMQMRVLFQFIAVALIALATLIMSGR